MSTKFNNGGETAAQGLFESSAVQQHELGETMRTSDGRLFRYAKAGASDLVAGKLQQAAAEITNHQNLAVTAAAAGATTVTVTLGATAATANQYAGGYAFITVTPGVGYQYLIKSHPAANSSATLVLTLEDPIQVALTTSSKIDLVPNPYNGVIVNPATASSTPVGVATFPVTANYFAWLQVGGIANVLADGTVTVGTALAASNAVAGAVEPLTGVQAPVGIAVTGIANTEYGAVKLMLA